MSRKTGGKTVRLGAGTLRGKGPRDLTETYTLLLSQNEYEEIEALVGNGSFSTAYFQTSSPDETEDQLRVIIGLKAEYHAVKPISATLTTIRVRSEVGVRVTSQEYETDWDSIDETFLIAAAADITFDEGYQAGTATDDGYYWFADIGDWTVDHTNDKLYCDATTGGGADNNVALIRKTDGHDFVVSDIEVECTVNVYDYGGGGTDEAGICFRVQHNPTGTARGYGYYWTVDPGDDQQIRLTLNEGAGAATILYQASKTTAYETDYKLKVIIQGDRIDLYFADEYIGTVYDSTYHAGMIGVFDTNIDANTQAFDNFKTELVKPVVVPCPVGAQGINQHITHEVFSNEGKLQYVIAPEGDVVYDQKAAMIDSDATVLSLPLDEGYGTPVDQAYNHTITLNNSPTWIEGNNRWTQKGLQFIGASTQSLQVTDANPLDVEIITTIQWIQFKSWHASNDSYFLNKNATYGHHYDVGDGYWKTVLQIEGSSREVSSGYSLALDTDYCLVFTFDGQTWRWYVDGTLVNSSTTYQGRIDTTANALYIPHNASTNMGNVELYDARVLNRALTASEIAYLSRGYGEFSGGEVRAFDSAGYELSEDDLILRCHFDEGRGTTVFDSSGLGHDSTGGTWPDWVLDGSASPEYRHCLDFELASSEYVDFGDHANFSFAGDIPFSVEAWIKLESNNIWQAIVSKYDTVADQREWQFNINTTGHARLVLFNPDGTIYIGGIAATVMSTGVWYYVVGTYDGSETTSGITMYINGVDDTDTPISAGVYAGMTAGTAELLFGATVSGTANFFDGLIDEPELWGRELTAAEIQKRYELGPILHDRTNWVPIRKPMSTKDLVGDRLIVENGFSRLEIIPRDGLQPLIKLYTFTDGFWKHTGQAVVTWEIFESLWPSLYSNNIYTQWDIRLTEITKDRLVIEMRSEANSNISYKENLPIGIRLILRAGYPGLLIESLAPSVFKLMAAGTHQEYVAGGLTVNSSLMPRFAWVPGNDPIDALLAAITENHPNSDDNYIVWFDPNLDVVFTQFKNQPNDATYGFACTTDTVDDRIMSIDVYGDDSLAPCYRGGVAFTAFDVSQLYTEGEDWTDTGQGAVADAAATSGTCIKIGSAGP